MDHTKDNQEEWIDLDGTRTVWLKVNYNQKYIPPITHLEFLYMPQEGDYLVSEITDIQRVKAFSDRKYQRNLTVCRSP